MAMEEIEIPDIDQLRTMTSVKWTRDDPDVLPAWVADMDIRPPAAVVEALQGVLDRRDFGYNRRAVQALPDTFARWQQAHHGWAVDPAEVRMFCDVLHAIDVALWLHTEPGDGVILLTPIYPPFLVALESSKRRLVDVPLDPDGWRLDPDRLRAAVDPGTKAILLCNPHNPTGRVFDQAELRAIADIAIEHDLLLLSDEVWGDLVYPGSTHQPLAALGPEVAAQTVTISSVSKAFNLAGLRCAVAHLGHQGMASQIEALPGHLLGAVSTPGAEAALAAWTEGEEWLQDVRRHLAGRRDQLAARLGADLPQVGFQIPQATYLAWLDFRPLGLGDAPNERLLEVGRVALSPGSAFGPLGDGFARLNFATSELILDEILDRIVSAIGG
ncbi:MAG: aminotransferase class I/II-fold pyridoxal phosphate-dependent enzyme [Actinomycetia bacterium]|nr:aminotransferase class I/II-fold pyridoxal phosphate-dependent enzyme [Actinomycetes bacterium]MCP4226264.1 aminotransferase class I/II-fold pyridoxal phosphate-dependent enzyme [Actinomycetes bacterium]MCP5032133.1 aminotransferase class I/II-fold pyridoxal phosphate-dependent enzyme [Actinomycetes bacterium]